MFLFSMIVLVAGLPQPVETTTIGGVGQETPAAEAGLQEGDTIMAINGTETRRWEDVSTLIKNSEGREVVLTLQREGKTLEVAVTPRMETTRNIFGEEVGQRYMVGIARSEEVTYERVGFIKSLQAGVSQTWSWMYLTVMGLVKIIQKVVPASELGGPILIAKIAGERMEAGWVNFLYFMGVLSVNLGILNLLPIPILDGGHLVFFSVEAILRKPLNLRTMEILQQIGLVLLGTLMIFVFYNDLVRVFSN
jgi:regulator of sigma E protease